MTVRNVLTATTTAASNTVTAAGSGLAATLQLGEAFIAEELTKARVRNKETRKAWAMELTAEVRTREAKAVEKLKALGLTEEMIQQDVDRILANFE